MTRSIGVLGSTGSIGRNTLDVIRRHPGRLRVAVLAAGRNIPLLLEQMREFRPDFVSVTAEEDLARIDDRCRELEIRSSFGDEGLVRAATHRGVELVVLAVTGAAGLKPAFAAVERGISLAVANKESLVMAGELIIELAGRTGAAVLPVDSEHSAIFQCLHGRSPEQVRRLILTASGGPFRGMERHELDEVSPEQALKHPTWRMGPKISVDSATLMNKALELVEACRLFGVGPEQVEAVIHPQSMIHAMVEFTDGSLMAQLGPPDMRIPIRQALSHPEVWGPPMTPFDPARCGPLTFEPVDAQTFPSMELAREALKTGGTAPAAMSISNEIAVDAFLNGKIGLTAIWSVIERVLTGHRAEPVETLDRVLSVSKACGEEATRIVGELGR